ncbi:MAG: dephospho-CoA kinase [Deltaproteobacteria bacterium]|nr:dephospho-CoA kinase [Deltaproteobacteria bacterium]MBW2649433.1 dephospho-CoA kinase [Deltaproteobacteria bacterium]
MINIGLTGGIGSGKSTVARLFQKRGAHIIDVDVLAHMVEEPGSAVWNRIVEHFGREILDKDDRINREALGGIVFRDSEKLEKLNSIVHPAIFDEWWRRFDDIANNDKEAIIISDIPLLVEVGWHKAVDIVILVYTSPDVQAERIMKRNGYSHKEAQDRLNSQMPVDEKIPFADFVINNEGTPEETEAIVDRIWKDLLKKSSSPD